jgi:hypothetical protein
MKVFILDDEVGPIHYRNVMIKALDGHQLTVAYSKDQAIEIYKPVHDLLLLDHDMRGLFDVSTHPSTAFHFVKHMVLLHHKKMPRIILHSQNPGGRANMRKVLRDHGFKAEEFPFSGTYVEWLKTL